jgi:hypothetical protein
VKSTWLKPFFVYGCFTVCRVRQEKADDGMPNGLGQVKQKLFVCVKRLFDAFRIVKLRHGHTDFVMQALIKNGQNHNRQCGEYQVVKEHVSELVDYGRRKSAVKLKPKQDHGERDTFQVEIEDHIRYS